MAVLVGGEFCERGVIFGELFEDGRFVGGPVGDVVEVAVQLIGHEALGGLTSIVSPG